MKTREKVNNMRRAMILTAIVSVALAAPAMARNYYKWTDENGTTHYSARKPHDQDAQVIRVTGTGRSSASETEADNTQGDSRQANSSAGQSAASTRNKDPERCEWARGNLEVLRNSSRVRMQDEDGEIRYLSDEEKAEQVREAEKAAEESC